MYRSSNADLLQSVSSADAITTSGMRGFPICAMMIMMMAELPEEGMSHSLGQRDPRPVVVSEHLVEKVKEHPMFWTLLFHVFLAQKYKHKSAF